nr:MAG TPA: endopeptidase tail [Caudoviricetes sp.]
MSYKVYAGVQSAVDVWTTKACIYDPSDLTESKKLLSPTLTRKLGKAGSLEFTIPLGNVAHSALQKLRMTVSVEQDGAEIWQGRIMSHEQDFMLRQKVYCEGELAYLNDSSIAPYTATNITLTQFLDFICQNHSGMVDSYKSFRVGEVQEEAVRFTVRADGCYIREDYKSDGPDSDGDYKYEFSLYLPSGTRLTQKFEELYSANENYTPAACEWPIGSVQDKSDYSIWRTGENRFSVRMNVVYEGGGTYTATQKSVESSVSCATRSISFGTNVSLTATTTPSTAYQVRKSGDTYKVFVSGKESADFYPEKAPVFYNFGDGKAYGVTMDVLQDELLDKHGGYLMVRHAKDASGIPRRYLDYVTDIAEKTDQEIKFGSNLLDLTSYVKAENIVTRVIAVGKKKSGWFLWRHESTITATANDTAAQKLFGIITRIIVIDGTASTTQSLRNAADKELSKNLRYVDGITIKAVDLRDAGVNIDRLAFAKQTHIYSEPHGVNTWLLCTKLVEPFDSPDKKEFTFGTEFSSISDLQALSARRASDAYDLSRALKGYATS